MAFYEIPAHFQPLQNLTFVLPLQAVGEGTVQREAVLLAPPTGGTGQPHGLVNCAYAMQ